MTGGDSLRERLVRAASPRATWTAVALYVASVVALTASDNRIAHFAPDVTKPDLRFGYGYPELVGVLEAFGPGGREAYAWNLAIDSVMPILFAAATLLVVARALPRWLGVLGLAPVAFAVLDLIENAAFAAMLAQYPAVSEALVSATRWITMVKLSAFYIAMPTLVLCGTFLLVRGMRRRWRSRST